MSRPPHSTNTPEFPPHAHGAATVALVRETANEWYRVALNGADRPKRASSNAERRGYVNYGIHVGPVFTQHTFRTKTERCPNDSNGVCA